jgi:hypothetical protein
MPGTVGAKVMTTVQLVPGGGPVPWHPSEAMLNPLPLTKAEPGTIEVMFVIVKVADDLVPTGTLP